MEIGKFTAVEATILLNTLWYRLEGLCSELNQMNIQNFELTVRIACFVDADDLVGVNELCYDFMIDILFNK